MKEQSTTRTAWMLAALASTYWLQPAGAARAASVAEPALDSVAVAAARTDAPGAEAAASATTAASEDGNAPTLAQEKDRSFVIKASQAGRQELTAAREAQRLSGRDDTRQLAAMLQQDHTAVGGQLQQIIVAKGWVIPEAKARSDAAPVSVAFSDEHYLSVQLAAHDEAIALFKDESSEGSDPDLRQFASLTLATLQKHRVMVQSLLTRVSGPRG